MPLFPDGPKPIKPVEQYPKPKPKPKDQKASADEKSVEEEKAASVGGVPISIVITVGVIILCINCIAMVIIYYQRDKLRRQALNVKTDPENKPEEAGTSEIEASTASAADDKDTDRKSRRKKRSSEKEEQDTRTGSTSRTSSISRENSTKRKVILNYKYSTPKSSISSALPLVLYSNYRQILQNRIVVDILGIVFMNLLSINEGIGFFSNFYLNKNI